MKKVIETFILKYNTYVLKRKGLLYAPNPWTRPTIILCPKCTFNSKITKNAGLLVCSESQKTRYGATMRIGRCSKFILEESLYD